jgi:hypothetical protein
LPRERELSLAHAQRCSFLIKEQGYSPLSVEIFPGKHCDFSTYLAKRAGAEPGACAEMQFPDYGTVLWSPGSRNWFQESTAISATLLPRERELSLAHAQRCRFLITDQSCGTLAVGSVTGKHCNFSKYLAKRAQAQSVACAEVQFPDYGTVLCSPNSRNCSRKALRFQHLFGQESESSTCACAEVQFPDY